MILRLRSVLLSVAAASLLANGAHALTGTHQDRLTSGLDPRSVRYDRSGDAVSAVSFRMVTNGKRVRVRVNPGDTWHACSTVGTTVACPLQNRPVTTVNDLEIQTI
jgi:hypothetical protein